MQLKEIFKYAISPAFVIATLLVVSPVVHLQTTPTLEALGAQEKIIYFYGNGCPHCADVDAYFKSEDIYSKYNIEKREIYSNGQNAILFNQVMDELGVPTRQRGVPTILIGDKTLVGGASIISNFLLEAEAYKLPESVESTSQEAMPLSDSPGKLDLSLALVLGASLVDAINPCAFAVLIILMSTILASGDSKKALHAGLAFASSIFISYFLMGLGIYSALATAGITGIVMKIVGWLAIALGLLNLKDYFWYGKGFLMEVPMSWRPKMKSLIQSVTSPTGAFLTGFAVSLFLLPCTSGPYIVILGMLAHNALNIKALTYLAIYNLVFVAPMILITLAVYKGFDPSKAEEIRQKRLRVLHLIAGIVLLIMGGLIILGYV